MSENVFEGVFEVEDGYVTGKRPQHFEVRAEHLDDFDGPDEARAFIEDWIQNEFEQRISWYSTSIDAFVEWAMAQKEQA